MIEYISFFIGRWSGDRSHYSKYTLILIYLDICGYKVCSKFHISSLNIECFCYFDTKHMLWVYFSTTNMEFRILRIVSVFSLIANTKNVWQKSASEKNIQINCYSLMMIHEAAWPIFQWHNNTQISGKRSLIVHFCECSLNDIFCPSPPP